MTLKPTPAETLRAAARLLLKGRYRLTFDQIQFPDQRLSICKRLNLGLQGIHLIRGGVPRFSLPPILQLEPINACNLSCLTCPTGAGLMRRPIRAMPLELYRRIIEEVKRSVLLLVFWSWGEPFLHPHATGMIRIAKDNGLLVHCSSNGHFFQNGGRAREVIDSGLDSLIVAVDGLDQRTYSRYRRNGDLKRVLDGIERIAAARERANATHPLITFRFIVMKHNEHQLERVRRTAAGVGADLVSFRSALVCRQQLDYGRELTPERPEYCGRRKGDADDDGSEENRGEFYCPRPYANLTVFSGGEVVLCENDFNAGYPLGNIGRQTLSGICVSRAFRQRMRRFIGQKKGYDFCRECDRSTLGLPTANVRTEIIDAERYRQFLSPLTQRLESSASGAFCG